GADLDDPPERLRPQVRRERVHRFARPHCEPPRPLAPVVEARQRVRVGEELFELGERRQPSVAVQMFQRRERQLAAPFGLGAAEEVVRPRAQRAQLAQHVFQNRLSCFGGSGGGLTAAGRSGSRSSRSARMPGSFATSSSSVLRSDGWWSAAAGWYIGNTVTLPTLRGCPCTTAMRCPGRKRASE